MRYARKRDLSEPGIVATLRAVGCKVLIANDVDLFVRCPKGQGYLLEIKTPGNKHRQPIQKELAEIFGDDYKIVSTSKEALAAIGYYE